MKAIYKSGKRAIIFLLLIFISIYHLNAATFTVVPQDVKCYGGNDGKITINITSGPSTFQYFLYDGWPTPGNLLGVSGPTASMTYEFNIGNTAAPHITARDYTVVVKDGGFTTGLDVTVGQPSAALSVSITSQTNISCNGVSDGSVTLSGAGGTPAYSYKVDGLAYDGLATKSGLAVGPHLFYIKDVNSCESTVSGTITEPSVISITSTSTTNVTCNGSNDGTVKVTATGGTGTLTYKLKKSGTLSDTKTGASGVQVVFSVYAGSYTVEVTDGNNCGPKISGTLTVTEPAALAASLSKINVTGCFGNTNGSITISAASGGSNAYEYTINGGTTWLPSGSFTSLIAGSLQCSKSEIKNAPTCIKILNAGYVITQPPQHTVTRIDVTNIPCPESGNVGSIAFVGTSGGPSTNYNWSIDNGASWNGISSTFTNKAAGTYKLKIRDAVNTTCITSFGDWVITRPATLTATITFTNIKCSGNSDGTITAVATGGTAPYTYTLKLAGVDVGLPNATGVFTGLAPGATYTVTVKDNVPACTSYTSSNIAITEPAPLTVTVTPNPAAGCISTPIALTANPVGGNGGNVFEWTAPTGGSFDDVTSQTPNYTHNTGGPFSANVKVTDSKGCIANGSTAITINPNNTVSLTSAAGTNAQTVCISTPIAPITYATTGATGATVSNLPTGVTGTWAGNVVTISGTPTVAGAAKTYTVTLTGGCGTITATGTIAVKPQ